MRLNLPALEATEAAQTPFPHMVVRHALSDTEVSAAIRDFPRLDMAGLFPPDVLKYGPAFQQLLDELQGPEVRAIMERKFDVDLAGHPTLATVRACARPRDGQIHLDAKFKLVTMLLYLNEPWRPDGGRLRVLRSGSDLDDHAGEVAPEGGLLFAFKCTPNAWHGHKPFVGVRRYIMINYCSDRRMLEREQARHRLSARVKQATRVLGLGKIAAA